MTTKRLLVLQIVLMLGMSAIFLLPAIPDQQPVGINLDLPEMIGEWYGQDAPVADGERSTLGYDTEFSRKVYNNGRGGEVFVSIVLGGRDMNTSIHRPERCLPAQGWTIADSHEVGIPLTTPKDAVLLTTRLHDMRPIRTDNGQTYNVYNLNYYWFVGYTSLTASHMKRSLIDIRDRLFHGYTQRWAYVTVAATITSGFDKFGRSEKQTDEMIQSFIQQLVPLVQKSSVTYN